MALLSFKKKENEVTQKSVCTCNSGSSTLEATKADSFNKCCSSTNDRISSIQVLGSGCASCHTLYENAQTAVNLMELPAKVEYITDLETVMKYGVMRLPALVVNDKVLSMGKVLKVGDIKKLLKSDSNS